MEEEMTEITRDTVLTKELLQELKDEYKKLYRVVLVDGTEVIFKRVSRNEYKEIMRKYNEIENREERLWYREEEVCRKCIVYPCAEVVDEILSSMAGVSSVLCDEIYMRSGFSMNLKSDEI
jgi:hypothetical protein